MGLLDRLLGGRSRAARSASLGTGVWRRTVEDCTSSVRRTRALAVLDTAQLTVVTGALRRVELVCAEGQAMQPSATLDVPSGRARPAYDQVRAVDRGLREVEYRTALLAAGDETQRPLLDRALDALADPPISRSTR